MCHVSKCMCLSNVNIFTLVGMISRAEPEIKTWFGVVSLESNSRKQQWEWEQWGREGGHFTGGMLWSFAIELLCWQWELTLARPSKRRKEKRKERERERKGKKKATERKKRKKGKEFNWVHYQLCCSLVLKVKLIFTMYLLHHPFYISLNSKEKISP